MYSCNLDIAIFSNGRSLYLKYGCIWDMIIDELDYLGDLGHFSPFLWITWVCRSTKEFGLAVTNKIFTTALLESIVKITYRLNVTK